MTLFRHIYRREELVSRVKFAEVQRRFLSVFGTGFLLLFVATPPSRAQLAASAITRLNELGPENQVSAQRVGLWDLTETVWASRDAAPVTTTGLVAERRRLGSLLQEILRSPGDTPERAVKRTDMLSFNRLEGRWDYVSFDTRAPVGIMSAWSTARAHGNTIDLTFAPFAIPVAGGGNTSGVLGQLIRMEQTIEYQDADHDVKSQYFTLADGVGTRWLAHRYAYVRRQP